MRFFHPTILFCWLSSLFLATSASSAGADATTTAPNPKIEALGISTGLKASISDAARSACNDCRLLDFERRLLVDDIAHYRVTLQVGPGQFDRIGLHRVVRERAPYRPSFSRQSVFLAHGINVGFEGTFLANIGVSGADPGLNLPVFLARNGVDVWGIDFRWILVPGEVEDLDFMAEWGLERDAEDLRIGLAAARLGRKLSRSGGGKMDLVGYSRGGRISYVYLNDESQRPRRFRHVKRFVQLDANFKTANVERQQLACTQIDEVQAEIDSGNVASDNRFLSTMGQLAQTAPNDPSPFFSGFSNRQAALLVGTLPPGGSGTFHLFAGIFEQGLPIDLAYTFEPVAVNLLASTASYQPLAGQRDLLIVFCDDGRSELDDHLAEVTVPVFYLGAAGGNGEGGVDTFPFLGSTELQSVVVSLQAPGQELLDVGHGDLLTMETAPTLVWQPILDWITTR